MTPNEEQMLETVSRFAQAYQSADIPRALTPFSEKARLVAADGRVYEGLDEIRSRLNEEASFRVVQSGSARNQSDRVRRNWDRPVAIRSHRNE